MDDTAEGFGWIGENRGETVEAVTVNKQKYFLRPTEFWHLFAEDVFLKHNILVAQGIIHTASLTATFPGLETSICPYGYKAMRDDKEQFWEEARRKVYRPLPSRIGAFYLFPSQQIASDANDKWFYGKRELVRARIVYARGSAHHVADGRLLDCDMSEWEANAEKYWRGKMTDDPLPEVIVSGTIYFPDWKTIGELAKP